MWRSSTVVCIVVISSEKNYLDSFLFLFVTENRSNESDEEYLQSFMNEVSIKHSNGTKAHPIGHSTRSTPDSSFHDVFRDLSSPLSPLRSDERRTPSQLFEDDIVVVSESFVEASAFSPSFRFEESELDRLPTDNITRGPPVSGG